MQLIVLGMHRSGTSVLARLLNLMGAYFGPEGISTGANPENPKGFWERRDVRRLNDDVLHSAGCDWDRVTNLDVAALPKAVVDDFNERASKLVLDLDGHRPWLLKEPRLCLLLPLWRRFLEVPVGIHIYRNPVEVASSLHKRNGIPILAGMDLWEYYIRSALSVSANMPRITVSHRQLMEEPDNALMRLAQDLQREGVSGLRLPTAHEIEAFVQADLYRERSSREDLGRYAKAPQLSIFRTLEAGSLPAIRKKGAGYTALAQYEKALPPLQSPSHEVKVTETTEEALRAQLALREQEIKFVRELSSKYEVDLRQRDTWLVRMEDNQKQVHHDFGQARERIGGLEAGIRARDERIKVLEAAHAVDLERVAKLESGIRTRDERIKELDAAHEKSHKSFASLTAELTQCAEQLRRAKAEASQSEQSHVAALREAEATVSKQKEQVTALVSQTAALDGAVDSLRSELKAKDSAMLELRELLGGREHENMLLAAAKLKVEQALEIRYQEIAKLSQRVLKRDRDLARAATKFDEAERRLLKQRQVRVQVENELTGIKRSRAWRLLNRLQLLVGLLGLSRKPAALLQHDLSLLRQSDLFDPEWYLAQYQDVASSGMDPVEHYLLSGAAELRNPGPDFDTAGYLRRNPDVSDTALNPLLHYITRGKDEGRSQR
jgi:hypothetical protein